MKINNSNLFNLLAERKKKKENLLTKDKIRLFIFKSVIILLINLKINIDNYNYYSIDSNRLPKKIKRKKQT